MNTFDWYLDRLGEPSRWNDRTKGKRDAHWPCPLGDGSPDEGTTSLHVTEKNGKALVRDFAHEHSVDEIDAALDDAPAPTRVTKSKRERRPAYAPTGQLVSEQVGGAWKPALRSMGVSPSDLHGGLPTLDGIGADEPIVLVEGHGPAIALNDIGIPAVCTVTGKSGTISKVGAAFLYGRTVVLSPDVGGDEHMDRCGSVVASVASKVLRAPEWPEDMPDNGDAADFIAQHGADAMRAHYTASTEWTAPTEDDDYLAGYADEIDYDDEPPPLLLGMLDPDDYSIIFGAGGVGKGVVVAWWIARLTKDEGYTVLLLDYEQNTKREWGPRVKRFGGDLSRLRVVQTSAAIWDVVDRVSEEADILRRDFDGAPTYLVIDSIGYAVGELNVEASATAIKYKKALNQINLPGLSLAHVTKENADPRYPFGSVFWHNNVRHTIGMSRKSEDNASPRVLKNRKANQRGEFAPVEVEWFGEHDPLPDALDFGAANFRTSDRIIDALRPGAKTIAEITEAVNADGGDEVKESAVSQALRRSKTFVSDGKKPAKWRLLFAASKGAKSVEIRPDEEVSR